MKYSIEQDLNAICDQLAASANSTIVTAVRNAIKAATDPIIEEAAKEMAAQLQARVESYRSAMDGRTVVQLSINSKRVG